MELSDVCGKRKLADDVVCDEPQRSVRKCPREHNNDMTITIHEDHQLKLETGSFYIPKDDKSHPRGEDAHFIWNERQTFGVADGVGGWLKHGIDAGAYARDLMVNCCVYTTMVSKDSLVDPKEVLVEGHSKTKVRGSATACIITVQQNNLYAANLGDSGFVVLRAGKIIYKSPVQQRRFNRPYQLGNGSQFDSPTVAKEIKYPVKAGDIIVAGTDGLFDNMFNQALEEIVRKAEGQGAEYMAECIADKASCNSVDRYSDTPFSVGSKQVGKRHRGGKIDDITVVVAFIKT